MVVFYTPPKFNMEPKMKAWKMFFLFKWVIFRFHVSFLGCTFEFEISLGPWAKTFWINCHMSWDLKKILLCLGKPSNNHNRSIHVYIQHFYYIYIYVYYSSVCLSPILLDYRHLPKAPQPTQVGLKSPGWSPFRCGSFCPTVQKNHTWRTDTAWRLHGAVFPYVPWDWYIYHTFTIDLW